PTAAPLTPSMRRLQIIHQGLRKVSRMRTRSSSPMMDSSTCGGALPLRTKYAAEGDSDTFSDPALGGRPMAAALSSKLVDSRAFEAGLLTDLSGMNVSSTDGDRLARSKESQRGRISQCGSGTGRREHPPSDRPSGQTRRSET